MGRGTRAAIRTADIRSYIECTNDEPKPFVWTKTADDILASIARYCSRVVHATASSANL